MGTNGVRADVLDVVCVVLFVSNAVIREALLPDDSLRYGKQASLSQAIRKPAFNQLHSAFEIDIEGGREEKMQVIGHDDELMQIVFLLLAIML